MFIEWLKIKQKIKLFKIELYHIDNKNNSIKLHDKKHYVTKMCFLKKTINSKSKRYCNFKFTDLLHHR